MPPPTIDKFSQWCLKPLGWSSHALAGIAAILSLWASMPPGVYLETLIFSAMLWVIVGLIWSIRALVRLVLAKVHRQPVSTLPGGWKTWLVAPLLLLGTVTMIHFNAPFSVAFALSRPAMERFAQQAMTTPPSASQQPQWVGLYRVYGFSTMPWGVRFHLHSGWDPSYGFAYSSHGTPPTEHGSNLSTDTYVPITGNWYEWQHDEDW